MTLTATDLQGAFPAVVTPFNEEGSQIDYESFKSLLDFQVTGGVSGVVVCGSTGETATLTDEEYRAVVTFAREYVGSRAIVIAGIGASSTQRAVELARFLDTVEVDGILLVTPPYNKPTQNGLVAHFRAVAQGCRRPLIAYNVPGRTGVNLLPKTVGRLVEDGLIIGLKESSGSIDQVLDTFAFVGNKIALLSGEDSLIHATMASGGVGTVSVVANIEPALVSTLTSAALRGHWEEAGELQRKMLPLARAVFTETNPIPIKAALSLRGLIRHPTTRLPLTPAEPSTIELLKRVLAL